MLFIHGLEKLEQFAHLKSRLVWDSYHIHSPSFQRCRSDVLTIHDSSWFMHAGLYCFIMVDIGSQVFVKRLQVVSTLFIIVYMSIRSRSVFCTKWVLFSSAHVAFYCHTANPCLAKARAVALGTSLHVG